MFDAVWMDVSKEARRRFATDAIATIAARHASEDGARFISNWQRLLELSKPTLITRKEPFAAAQFIRLFDRISASGLTPFLRLVYTTTRECQLKVLYRSLGVNTEEPVDPTSPPARNTEHFLAAYDVVAAEIGPDDALLLLGAVAAVGLDAWQAPSAEAVITLRQRRVDASTPKDAPPAKEATRTDIPERLGEMFPSGLREIDRLVTDEILRAMTSQHADDGRERAQLLVERLREINPLRPESNFHSGFLAALMDASMDTSSPEMNAARRLWYYAGYLQGFMRAHDQKRCLGVLDEIRVKIAEDGVPKRDMSAAAAYTWLIDPAIDLCVRAGRTDDAARLIDGSKPQDPMVIRKALALVREHLRQGKFDGARILLKSIKPESVDVLPRRAIDDDPWYQYHHATATLLRVSGQIQRADDIYSTLCDNAVDAAELSEAVTARVLCKAGIGDFCRFALTTANQEALVTAARFAGEQSSKQKNLRFDERATAVMAAASLVSASASQADRAAAAQTLKDARSSLSLRRAAHTQDERLLERIDAYIGMLDLHCGVEANAEGAARAIAAMLRHADADLVPPMQLCCNALNDAMVCGAASADELATAITEAFGIGAIGHLPVAEIGRRSNTVTRQLLQALRSSRAGLSPRQRLDFAISLLEGILSRSGASEVDLSCETLDVMQDAAECEQAAALRAAEFLEGNRDRLLCVLEESEIEASLADANIKAGRYAEAGRAFIGQMREALRASDIPYLTDLIEEAESLGVGDEIPEIMRRTVLGEPHGPVAASNGPVNAAGVCIFFVGGNEVQQRYQTVLREALHRQFSNLGIQFFHPGMGSNWIRSVDDVRVAAARLRPRVIVLSPLVRTQFGRHIRRLAGEHGMEWRACTGRGEKSMLRALLSAASRAVQLRGAVTHA